MTALGLEDFEDFASRLTLDNGRPMELEPFQRELIEDFTDPDVREVWCCLPEASGKSTLMAAFSLYYLMRTTGANVVFVSVTQAQAGSAMFRQASDMIARSPGLDRHLRAIDGRLRIYGPAKSRLDVKPSRPASAQGQIPNLVVADEVGELPTLDLVRVMRGKLSKREGAKLIVISSAGEPGSEFELLLEGMRATAEDVQREGRHTRYQTAAAVVHEWRLAEGDSLTDWAALKQANPLSSVTEETLREKFESPLTNEQHFRRYSAGVPEYSDDHVIARDVWEAARVNVADLGDEDFYHQLLGVDTAQSYDAFAIVPLTIYRSGLLLLGTAKILEPRRPGEPIPLEVQQEALRQVAYSLGGVDDVWVNPSTKSQPIEEWIYNEIGRTVAYGMTQAEAIDLAETFLSELHSGRLRHTGDQALTGHVLNATARWAWDEDRFMFTRPKESRRATNQRTRRIDALSAATLAVKGATKVPQPAR